MSLLLEDIITKDDKEKDRHLVNCRNFLDTKFGYYIIPTRWECKHLDSVRVIQDSALDLAEVLANSR